MKKLVLSLAILGFVAFGVISVQHLIASPSNIEMVNFDKDPKKDGDKKTAETKEVKATEAKANEADAKAGSSDCSDKAASSKSCCDKDKAACCPSSPDKK
jgi:Phr family secreted Rap phosphatase inhibitor